MIRNLIILLLCCCCCHAQQSDFEFVVEKIKTNYPGFEEKTKGKDFDAFVRKTIAAHPADTFKAMAKIVDFFQDRHLDLFRSADAVDTHACGQDLKRVCQYLASSQYKKKYEGYWLSDYKHCVIAVIQTGQNPMRYKGYVIEQRDSSIIPPGLVLYDFEQIESNNYFTRATISRNRNTMYVHSIFRNDSVMTAGPYNKWRRLKKYNAPLLPHTAQQPDTTTGRWVDRNTYLITIPASSAKNGELVDSIVRANPEIKERLETLIIDIRNNTGGKFSAYTHLLPLIYTDTMLEINSSLYMTKDDLAKNKAFVTDYIQKGDIDSAYLESWQSFIKMEEGSIGKFYSVPQDTLVFESVLTYPRHVAFIVNFACQSAAEMILLYALQSKKVTLFGEHTAGAVDYLNFSPMDTPSGKYQLYIAASRRNIPPGGTKLDGIGIQPHVPISDRESDWVDFVKRYYEKH